MITAVGVEKFSPADILVYLIGTIIVIVSVIGTIIVIDTIGTSAIRTCMIIHSSFLCTKHLYSV